MPRERALRRMARWYLRHWEDPLWEKVMTDLFCCALIAGTIFVAWIASLSFAWGVLTSMAWTVGLVRLFHWTYKREGDD